MATVASPGSRQPPCVGTLTAPGRRRFSPRVWHHDWHHLTALRRAVVETLEGHGLPRPGQRVVDLGCGDCPYEPIFRACRCEYVGCDLGDRADVRIEPGRPVPLPDACADGVVSFQVLEHVWDLDWYLGECRRLVKSGGWLLLSTHGTWLYHPHPTDFRRWTCDGLARELTERGFAVQTITPAVGPLAWTTQFRLLGLRHCLQRIPLLGPLALPPLAWLMNLRMTVEDFITPEAVRKGNASVYVTLSRKAGVSGGSA